MEFDFNNKVILVTGGSGDLGRAIVKKLVLNNAQVVFTYLNGKKEAELLISECNKIQKNKAISFQLDVRNVEEVNNLIQKIETSIGGIYAFVGNAGNTLNKLFYYTTQKDLHNIFETNFFGNFNLSKTILESMLLRELGKIIFISSVVGDRPVEGLSAYSSSKSALNSLAKSLAMEYAKYNIQVNCISPGYIQTRMLSNLDLKKDSKILSKIPAKRIGFPVEIANLTCFLLTDMCDYITGSTINCDGGLSCHM